MNAKNTYMMLQPLKRKTLWMLGLLLLFIAGCATKPKAGPKDYTFFPGPPDEPRIQFLTSFGFESELGGQSKLTEFVVGEEKVIRPIWKPYGITVTKGKLHICDTQPKNITTVDLVKKKFTYLRPSGGAAMQMPINVAVDNDGTRFVTDTVRGQVLIYDATDRLTAEIGKVGEMKPCGIALAGERLYVTDISNHCVRVYEKKTRELLFTAPPNALKKDGSSDPSDIQKRLFSPTNVAIDNEGKIYVSDSGGFVVQVYDAQGNHLRRIGDVGLKPGRFGLPKGIGVDREGRIYVIDAATAVAQVFDAEGGLLTFFGEPKTSGPAGLYLPAGLAIDYENVALFQKYAAPGKEIDFLIYVTNQAGPQKVSVFGFLKKG